MKLATKLLAMCFVLIFYSASTFAQNICETPVQTTEGVVIGKSVEKENACAYLGIPYAAPPVGTLRWRAPQPPVKRKEAYHAVSFGMRCMQAPLPGLKEEPDEPGTGEDCLYLNIWRPNKEGKFPVMVWIHGGGLINGSGSQSLYRGERLAGRKNVVLVTINYRLTVFGFLALPQMATESPDGSIGNFGLLDQIFALKWVRQNIASFGGDADNITIFGESAGGWSVCNLMASPLADGLFHKAIIESGGCDATKTVEEGFDDSAKFAIKAGCKGKNALACLRTLPSKKLLEYVGDLSEMVKNTVGGRIKFTWLPVEDGVVLKNTPIESIRKGEYNRVPLIVGSNKEEGKLFVMFFPGLRLLPKFACNQYVKRAFGEEFLEVFEKFYPYRNYKRPLDAILDTMGDIGLGCKNFDAAEATASVGGKVFYYRFDYNEHRLPNYLGSAHSTEIPFVFGWLDFSIGKLLFSSKQAKKAQPLADAMMSYWTNFARTGDPNGEGLPQWFSYDTSTRQRIYFDIPIRVAPTDNVDRCTYWASKNIRVK